MSCYYEFGDQLSRDVPPSGPVNIIFQRQYPGATPTPLATTAATAAANQAFIAAFKKAVTGARITMQK